MQFKWILPVMWSCHPVIMKKFPTFGNPWQLLAILGNCWQSLTGWPCLKFGWRRSLLGANFFDPKLIRISWAWLLNDNFMVPWELIKIIPWLMMSICYVLMTIYLGPLTIESISLTSLAPSFPEKNNQHDHYHHDMHHRRLQRYHD